MEASTVDTVENILQSAKKLNSIERLSVAHALLKDIPERMRSGIPLPLLTGLSEQDLEVLAKTFLSPSRHRRLNFLLKKNREKKLSQPEVTELDKLLAETDQIALLKAKAQYTLKKCKVNKICLISLLCYELKFGVTFMLPALLVVRLNT